MIKQAFSWFSNTLMIAAPTLGTATHAAKPWVAVPSGMGFDNVAVAAGGSTAGEPVKIRITDPAGQRYPQFEAADADGRVVVNITPNGAGKQSVDVYNAKGKRVGGGDRLYRPRMGGAA